METWTSPAEFFIWGMTCGLTLAGVQHFLGIAFSTRMWDWVFSD